MITLPEMYIEAVISTGHMTAEDNQTLARIVNEPEFYGLHDKPYGYELYVGEDLDYVITQLSAGCQANLAKIFAAGVTHLVIDRDGPVVDGLQSWEW